MVEAGKWIEEPPRKVLASGGCPSLCIPLVGRNRDEIAEELRQVLPKEPDLLEWRADYFGQVDRLESVLETIRWIEATAPTIPLLFTLRSAAEGGQAPHLDDGTIAEMCSAVCTQSGIAMLDFEMRHSPERIAQVCAAARAHGVGFLLSHHNFVRTPSVAEMESQFALAQQYGADTAKIAVMPESIDDVLALLIATRNASKALKIPVIGLAMGELGALSRWVGWTCGSAMSYVVGASASAPGQVPIEEMRQVLRAMQRSMRPPGVSFPPKMPGQDY